ncbi:hypothetical protein [Pseudoalteromonas prydzensis]|uniref:hypothetical protein n=1 Tax=Pseudoalteromonas prydzensis TaxID=182141 RepID=UPI003703F9C4
MNTILKLASALMLVMISGCTIVDGSAILTGEKRAEISVDKVRIYRVAPAEYEEVAMVSASAGHDFKSNSALIESTILRLKQEAAKLGANGVLLSEIDERDTPKSTVNIGSAQVNSSNGTSVYATSNNVSVNRGDSYTRMHGLAIFVKK